MPETSNIDTVELDLHYRRQALNRANDQVTEFSEDAARMRQLSAALIYEVQPLRTSFTRLRALHIAQTLSLIHISEPTRPY